MLISNSHYFFSCINYDEVIYKGEKPIFEEYGPYIYQEFDTFTNITYNVTQPVTGISDSDYSKNVDGKKEAEGLTAIYNQNLSFYEPMADQNDKTGKGLDEPLKVVNQAAFGVWWG